VNPRSGRLTYDSRLLQLGSELDRHPCSPRFGAFIPELNARTPMSDRHCASRSEPLDSFDDAFRKGISSNAAWFSLPPVCQKVGLEVRRTASMFAFKAGPSARSRCLTLSPSADRYSEWNYRSRFAKRGLRFGSGRPAAQAAYKWYPREDVHVWALMSMRRRFALAVARRTVSAQPWGDPQSRDSWRPLGP